VVSARPRWSWFIIHRLFFHGIIDGGMQDRSLLIQFSDVLVGDQRRFVKVEGRSTAEHGLDSNWLSHRARKPPLLDVTIKVNSLWHDHRHL
jgi:hypothetical protein